MRRIFQNSTIRRARRKAGTGLRPVPVLFFIALIVGAASLSMWIEDRHHRADIAYPPLPRAASVEAGRKTTQGGLADRQSVALSDGYFFK